MTQPTLLNYVTCAFGVPGSWAAGKHTGIDYRAAVGTEIYATRGGRVVWAGGNGPAGDAYGNYIMISSKYRGKERQHLYAHLSRVQVKKGQKVKAGDKIGLSGETGNTFGAHLHYEERVYPFTYYYYQKPVFPQWQPKNKRWLAGILRKIGYGNKR